MTAPTDAIQEVVGMLYNGGIACDFGVDESLLSFMINMAQTRYPNRQLGPLRIGYGGILRFQKKLFVAFGRVAYRLLLFSHTT